MFTSFRLTAIIQWLTGYHPKPVEEGPSALSRAFAAIEARSGEAGSARDEGPPAGDHAVAAPRLDG